MMQYQYPYGNGNRSIIPLIEERCNAQTACVGVQVKKNSLYDYSAWALLYDYKKLNSWPV
eukprot:Pgem_evm1s19568